MHKPEMRVADSDRANVPSCTASRDPRARSPETRDRKRVHSGERKTVVDIDEQSVEITSNQIEEYFS